MIDVDTPDSPGWWLKRCQAKLDDRLVRIVPLFDRYTGNTPLPSSLDTAPDTAKAFYKTSRTNLAEMIVKAVRYKTKVTCIQTSRDNGETGDAKAWKTWKRAGMLVEGPDIIRNMLVAGDGYAIGSMDGDVPVATAEDPRQVITIHDPLRQARVRAGAKFYRDHDLGISYAYLHRPGRLYVAKKAGRAGVRMSRARFDKSWDWSEEHGGAEGQPLPAGFENDVLIVRYRNDEAVSDFERHLDLLDRVDHLVLQGMVIATLQAFKQRAIKVDEQDMPDEDEETGEPIDYDEVFASDPGALWKLPAAAEMWESGTVDVTPIVNMVQKELERVSAVTFTPMSMFTPEGANQSAQGASLVREGATFKVEDKQDRIGAAHAQLAAMLFRMAKDTEIADPEDITIGWAPAERYSLAEKGAAATAAKASGVPWRTIMRDIWQFTPEQVERMESERMNDAILFPAESAATPPPAPTPEPASSGGA